MKPVFTQILILALLSAFASAQAQTLASGKRLDAIVVVVNGQPISSLDLQRRERFLVSQLKRADQTVPSQEELPTIVLERVIFETLMLQSGAKQGLVPSDSAVQQAMSDSASQSGLDMRAFIARIEQSGTTIADYMNDLKNEITISHVRERALATKLKVSESEVDRFLRETQSGISQELALQVIYYPKLESDTAQQLSLRLAKAKAIYLEAKNAKTDDTFVELQKKISDPIGNHVVNLGFRTMDKLPELFSSAVDSMVVGEVSSLLESSAGFYIVRLANKRTVLPQVTTTKVRHILIRGDSANSAAEEAARQTIKKLHDRLTLNMDLFPALAKEFSQDGSASNGGDLGWVVGGEMVPEFERIMEVLKEGDMALPIRTQFGWHILQVLERKTVDLPKERLRAQAKNMIKNRKQEEVFSDWLEELKAQAYIEYKPNAR
jgi:peptidyl-prolyl cis-trans isomerase SurA